MSETYDNIEEYEYRCKISQNMIKFRCYKKEQKALIELMNIDENIPKLFFVQLRASKDDLQNKNYKKIIQIVSEDDWNNYLSKSNWTVVQKFQYSYQEGSYYRIECDIDNMIECISTGLGFEYGNSVKK